MLVKLASYRDDLRKLPISQQKQIQKQAAHHIAAIEGDVIIDTHASVKTPIGYWSGLPANIIQEIGPDLIVLLEFQPDVVITRRQKDKTIQKPTKTETGRIINLAIYYAKPLYENEPTRFYPGIVEIEGCPIGRDDPIKKINASLKGIRFQPTQVGNVYETTHSGLRILINYKHRTSQIYSISMLFMSDRSD